MGEFTTFAALNDCDFPKFDLGIGLHCCGGLTDLVMELCAAKAANCIVAPCCHGGIAKYHHHGGIVAAAPPEPEPFTAAAPRARDGVARDDFVDAVVEPTTDPPQRLLRQLQHVLDHGDSQQISERCSLFSPRSDYFAHAVSQSWHGTLSEKYSTLTTAADDVQHPSARCLIELDRGLWARRRGWKDVDFLRMRPSSCTT